MTSSGTHVRRKKFLHDSPCRCAMSEQRGLRIQCESELLGGSVVAKVAQSERKRIVHLLEYFARSGKRVSEIFPHSRLLRTLPREQQYDVHG